MQGLGPTDDLRMLNLCQAVMRWSRQGRATASRHGCPPIEPSVSRTTAGAAGSSSEARRAPRVRRPSPTGGSRAAYDGRPGPGGACFSGRRSGGGRAACTNHSRSGKISSSGDGSGRGLSRAACSPPPAGPAAAAPPMDFSRCTAYCYPSCQRPQTKQAADVLSPRQHLTSISCLQSCCTSWLQCC